MKLFGIRQISYIFYKQSLKLTKITLNHQSKTQYDLKSLS
ncbi:hypothetical protein KM759_gp088 [Lymphocystis disease virus 4]|uniref:Uncharacterized protein n=1 Tax=Lymphocystis disease virus 4 TaxID=2704413 RepID=A0A6B9XN26_9VIRU|nr:hypothetical protein KM759_gp088 [Lymphocystis disease virus 4]QHR78578.1 hypothetical protein [Lymphocystis disease virus 4]